MPKINNRNTILNTAWKVSVFGVFLVYIFHIRTEYGDLKSKSPHSVRMQENKDQKNSEYGHFLHIESVKVVNVSNKITRTTSVFCKCWCFNCQLTTVSKRVLKKLPKYSRSIEAYLEPSWTFTMELFCKDG